MNIQMKGMQENACNTLPPIMADLSSWDIMPQQVYFVTVHSVTVFLLWPVLTVPDKHTWLFTAALGVCTFHLFTQPWTILFFFLKKTHSFHSQRRRIENTSPWETINNAWSHIKTNLQMFKAKPCFSISSFSPWWLLILHLLNNSGWNPNSLRTFSLNSCNIKWHKRWLHITE